MSVFSCEIPVNDSKKMEQFQDFMNEVADQTNDYIENLAKDLNISDSCAQDVWYLRTRSRHTPELEQELIRRHSQLKAGEYINMGEFPEEEIYEK